MTIDVCHFETLIFFPHVSLPCLHPQLKKIFLIWFCHYKQSQNLCYCWDGVRRTVVRPRHSPLYVHVDYIYIYIYFSTSLLKNVSMMSVMKVTLSRLWHQWCLWFKLFDDTTGLTLKGHVIKKLIYEGPVPNYVKSGSWCRLRRVHNWFGETTAGQEIGMGKGWTGNGEGEASLRATWDQGGPGSHHAKRRDSK